MISHAAFRELRLRDLVDATELSAHGWQGRVEEHAEWEFDDARGAAPPVDGWFGAVVMSARWTTLARSVDDGRDQVNR